MDRQNYEEYFLLYLDGELDEAGRAEVETFIQHYPELGEELNLLKQSVITADETVFFENKASLYKEEKCRAFVFFNWRRWSAAATLFLFIGAGAWVYINRKVNPAPAISMLKNPPAILQGQAPGLQPVSGSKTKIKESQGKITEPVNKMTALRSKKNYKEPGSTIIKSTGKAIAFTRKKNINDPGGKTIRSVDKINTIKPADKSIALASGTNLKKHNGKTITPADKISVNPIASIKSPAGQETIAVIKKPGVSMSSVSISSRDDKSREDGPATIVIALPPEKIKVPVYSLDRSEITYNEAHENSFEDHTIYVANTTISKKSNLKVLFRKASRIIDRITTLQLNN